ncbi:MAG: hypothetical protein U0168_04065 [Nannocystaceae bacterium]
MHTTASMLGSVARGGAQLAIASLILAACEVGGVVGDAALERATTGEESSSSSGAAAPEGPARPPDDGADGAQGSSTSADIDMPNDSSGSVGGVAFDLGDGESSTSDSSGASTLDVPCCEAADQPGCDDGALEACVCALDPYCCETAWDETCVSIATYSDCAGPCAAPTVAPADCCTAAMVGGCTDVDVQDCVCATDPYCCLTAWDDVCVGEVTELACGMCP